jgi:hypothetical protein
MLSVLLTSVTDVVRSTYAAMNLFHFMDDFDYNSISEMKTAGWQVMAEDLFSVDGRSVNMINDGSRVAKIRYMFQKPVATDWIAEVRASATPSSKYSQFSLDFIEEPNGYVYRWGCDEISRRCYLVRLDRGGLPGPGHRKFEWDGYVSPAKGTWVTLKIERNGETLYLYFNSRCVASYVEERPPQIAGIQLSPGPMSTISYDWIKVEEEAWNIVPDRTSDLIDSSGKIQPDLGKPYADLTSVSYRLSRQSLCFRFDLLGNIPNEEISAVVDSIWYQVFLDTDSDSKTGYVWGGRDFAPDYLLELSFGFRSKPPSLFFSVQKYSGTGRDFTWSRIRSTERSGNAAILAGGIETDYCTVTCRYEDVSVSRGAIVKLLARSGIRYEGKVYNDYTPEKGTVQVQVQETHVYAEKDFTFTINENHDLQVEIIETYHTRDEKQSQVGRFSIKGGQVLNLRVYDYETREELPPIFEKEGDTYYLGAKLNPPRAGDFRILLTFDWIGYVTRKQDEYFLALNWHTDLYPMPQRFVVKLPIGYEIARAEGMSYAASKENDRTIAKFSGVASPNEGFAWSLSYRPVSARTEMTTTTIPAQPQNYMSVFLAICLVLCAIILVVSMRTRKRTVPERPTVKPPLGSAPETKPLQKPILQEEEKISTLLVRLEELRQHGEIGDEAYEQLKREYSQRLKRKGSS